MESPVLAADGGVLSLPDLVSIPVSLNLGIDTYGGQVLLPGLTAISNPGLGVGIYSYDPGSLIDLASLQSITGGASRQLNVTGPATIIDPVLTSLDDVDVTLDGSAWRRRSGRP